MGGWKTAGGDVSILDVNNDGTMDAVFVASVDANPSTGRSEYRYRVALSFNPATADFAYWGSIKGFERVWTGPTTTAIGLAHGSINGNSNSRDFLFVAVGNFNGFRVVFRPAFDMNTNGDIPLR